MKNAILPLLFLPLCCAAQHYKSFNNGKHTIYYEEFGSGPALYILTGGPGAHPEYPGYMIIDSLKTQYTCVLLHQRGAGWTKFIPVNADNFSIAKYTQDIELLRRQRGDKKVVLLGISWGGLLAMNYAAHHPQHVSNLVLLCSAPPSYTLWNVLYDNQYARRSPEELKRMDSLRQVFSTKSPEHLDVLKLNSPHTPEAQAFKEFTLLHSRAMYYRRNAIPYMFDHFFQRFNFQPIPIIDQEIMETRWDITDKLKRLNIPALILYGRQDDQGESTFYLQKECLRNSRMHVIEQCGHIMWEDQPEAFFRVLTGYLRK